MRAVVATLVSLFAVACYSPNIPNGAEECSAAGKCPEGFVCAADNHCYKPGTMPNCPACSGATPICDKTTLQCVQCLVNTDCPTGETCSSKQCVTEHNDFSVTNLDMSTGCTSDGDCPTTTPRCAPGGTCVVCLPTADNCPAGSYCNQATGGSYSCLTGCKVDGDCPSTDAGATQSCCNHACLDTSSDDANCGGCGHVCNGTTCCSGTCSDLTTDVNHCGTCATSCGGANSTASCSGGMCKVGMCVTGYADCNGIVSDGCESLLASDPMNCGMCGTVCPSVTNGVPTCTNSTCGVGSCSTGFADCNNNAGDGCETATTTDPSNCGACGTVCPLGTDVATASCTSSMCGIGTCVTGFADCNGVVGDGCEINTQTDVNNCNGCSNVCPVPTGAATAGCSGGACGVGTCQSGLADCNGLASDGCEVNLTSDINNCSKCGTKCAVTNGTPGCGTTGCVIKACNAGFGDCNNTYSDGCETSTTGNNNNCGACGKVCGTGTVCQNSTCVAATVSRVLVVTGFGPTGTFIDCLVTSIKPFYSVVDVIVGPPTATQLANYDGVLVYNNGSHPDPTTLGNVMADYFDVHGHVVEALYGTGGLSPMGGRWQTGAYPLIRGSYSGTSVSLGTVNEPNSPLMLGVTSLTTSRSVTSASAVVNGGIVVAQFNNGTPVVVRGTHTGHNRADLAIFPGGCDSGINVGNFPQLIRNAINF